MSEGNFIKRGVTAFAWNIASQAIQFIILFIRSVALARILSPETFGVYAFALAIINPTKALPAFGLGTAYLHRVPETEHKDAISVYFTLISTFTLVWAVLLLIYSAFWVSIERRWVLWVLVVTTFISQLSAPAHSVLVKRISFRRIAILNLVVALLTTPIAIFLAWKGAGVWSLVSCDIVTAVILNMGYYVVKPVWRPRLVWSRPIANYFVKFGGRVVWSGLLNQAIDKLDEIWTGYFLNDAALGFYSRAYHFANYPRQLLVTPIYAVVMSMYAEAKDEYARLSRVFSSINMVVIRVTFFVSGGLFLISPEFVYLVLGEKWLPMLDAFRLMVVYTMLDPVRITIGDMFSVIGQPEVLIQTRTIQLIVLVVGLMLLGPRYGIAGVAIAATSMVTIGVGILIWRARKYVEFSYTDLFGTPTLVLFVGLFIVHSLIPDRDSLNISWQLAVIRFVIFALVYLLTVVLVDRRQLFDIFLLVKNSLSRKAD